MKNAFKLFGIAVLVTAIGFSAASCKNDDPITVTVTGIPANETESMMLVFVDYDPPNLGSRSTKISGSNATFDHGPHIKAGNYTVALWNTSQGTLSAGKKSISAGDNKIPWGDFKKKD